VVVPATITKRTDTGIEYDMTNYTSDPTLVQELETLQASYPKMQNVINNMLMNIRQGMALDILYSWRPTAANLIETTGAIKVSGLAGTTGSRKLISFADLVALATKMDEDEVPEEGRKLLLPSTLYNTLLLDEDIKENFNSKLADLSKGIVGNVLGFEVMKRSKVLVSSGAGVIKLPGAAAAATDSHTGIAWQPAFVGASKGNVQVYADAEPRPEYYGRVISSESNAGGSKCYADGRGVYGIRQATA
jgi:hypothetical protein